MVEYSRSISEEAIINPLVGSLLKCLNLLKSSANNFPGIENGGTALILSFNTSFRTSRLLIIITFKSGLTAQARISGHCSFADNSLLIGASFVSKELTIPCCAAVTSTTLPSITSFIFSSSIPKPKSFRYKLPGPNCNIFSAA